METEKKKGWLATQVAKSVIAFSAVSAVVAGSFVTANVNSVEDMNVNDFTASAKTGWGSGGTGGSSGSGTVGNYAWHVIEGKGGKTAYQRLKTRIQNGPWNTAWGSRGPAARNLEKELADITRKTGINCKTADVILYFGVASDPRKPAVHFNNALSFRLPSHTQTKDRKLLLSEWAQVKPILKNSDVAACGNFGPTTEIVEQHRRCIQEDSRTRETVDKSARTVTGVAQRTARILPQFIPEGSVGTSQSRAETTEFGKLAQDVASKSYGTSQTEYNRLLKDIDKAIENSKVAPDNTKFWSSTNTGGKSPWIKMGQNNQATFTNGAVYNLTQLTRERTIHVPALVNRQGQKRIRHGWVTPVSGQKVQKNSDRVEVVRTSGNSKPGQSCQYRQIERDLHTGKTVRVVRNWTNRVSWRNWTSWSNYGSGTKLMKSNPTADNLQSAKEDAFSQMIGANCNREDFEAAVGNVAKAADGTSAEILKATGNETTGNTPDYRGVAYTPTYKNIQDAMARNGGSLPFGDSGHAKNGATGTNEFYQSSCYFPTEKHGDAVQTANGDAIGASAEGDGNYLAFTRDNTDNQLNFSVVKPDVDNISPGNTVKPLTNDTPFATLVTRWEDGTPGPSSQNGTFTMTDDSSKKVFTGNDKFSIPSDVDDAKSQAIGKSNQTAAVLNGVHNTFNVKADWPSESGKPERLNIAWLYDVEMQSNHYESMRPGAPITHNSAPAVTFPHANSDYSLNKVSVNYLDFVTGDNAGNSSLEEHVKNDFGAGVEFKGHQENNDGDNGSNLNIDFVRNVNER